MPMTISTHVLDTGRGTAAAGLAVALHAARDDGGWDALETGVTDADGRAGPVRRRQRGGAAAARVHHGCRLSASSPRWRSRSWRRPASTATSRCCSARSATRPTGGASHHARRTRRQPVRQGGGAGGARAPRRGRALAQGPQRRHHAVRRHGGGPPDRRQRQRRPPRTRRRTRCTRSPPSTASARSRTSRCGSARHFVRGLRADPARPRADRGVRLGAARRGGEPHRTRSAAPAARSAPPPPCATRPASGSSPASPTSSCSSRPARSSRATSSDKYTTLEPTRDRILATAVTARWRHAGAEADWGESFAAHPRAAPGDVREHAQPVAAADPARDGRRPSWRRDPRSSRCACRCRTSTTSWST